MDDVDVARSRLGLPADRFADVGGGINQGNRIVCQCGGCGKLFISRSHDLADLDHINKGDCGCASPNQ